MPVVMSVEDRLVDLLSIVSTCLDNMIHVPTPINKDLYAFSDEWLSVPKKPKFMDDLLTNKDCLFNVALAGITKCDTVVIDSDDYEDVEAGELINTSFSYDTAYRYEDFFVALMVSAHQIQTLLPSVEDEDKYEALEQACKFTAMAYMALRKDTMSKLVVAENMDSIALMALAWKEIFDNLEGEDENDD